MKSVQELEKELVKVRESKMQAVKDQNFEVACSFRDKEKDLMEMIQVKKDKVLKDL
jgi:ATP-dependent Clp protease ATP-binding subunit ClpC